MTIKFLLPSSYWICFYRNASDNDFGYFASGIAKYQGKPLSNMSKGGVVC
jgi:hypothetical protein